MTAPKRRTVGMPFAASPKAVGSLFNPKVTPRRVLVRFQKVFGYTSFTSNLAVIQ
jgi:hypothetical protein